MPVDLQEQKTREAPVTRAYALVVAQFLVTWVFFLVLLVGTAVLVNIDWARPQLEQMLSQALNRRVLMGRMSWSLGLNGLAIATNKLKVEEKDGKPFVTAGFSEMGVAFLPLIEGKLIIRHVKFQQPEMWAIKDPQGLWNFNDLLKPGPEIRFVELDGGKLHLRDQSAGQAALPNYDLDKIGLKFTFPREKRRWPVYLSFDLPRKGYNTSFRLTTIGNGSADRWQNNEYRFNWRADQLNPIDFPYLASRLPGVTGLYSLRLSGSGTFNKALLGNFDASVSDMSLPVPRLGQLQAKQATCQAHLKLDRRTFVWEDLVFSLGDLAIRSKGQVSGWQANEPGCQASLSGKVKDLRCLSQHLPAHACLSPERIGELSALVGSSKLSGEAEFKIDLHACGQQQKLQAQIKAEGLPAQQLLDKKTLADLKIPWLATFLGQPGATMRGEVRVTDGNKIELSDLEVTAAGSALHVNGFVERQGTNAQLSITGRDIDLAIFSQALGHTLPLSQSLPAARNSCGVTMAGRADLKGTYTNDRGRGKLALVSKLNGAQAIVTATGAAYKNLFGEIALDDHRIRLTELKGNAGRGSFALDGEITFSGQPSCKLAFTGQSFDLDHLTRALQTFQVKAPLLSQHQLYGQVKQLSMKVEGRLSSPRISLRMTPEELYYQAPGVSRPLRATAGSITYEDDALTLKEVPLGSRGNQLIADLQITNLSSSADLRRVRVKSTGIELNDVHFYLSSALMPGALRQQYLDFVSRFNLTATRGKAYGNLFWQAKDSDQFDLDGILGLYNTSLKVGKNDWPLEHLSGILAASGEELLVQDFSGSIGGNEFTADGHITNYRSPKARFQTEVRAQVSPNKALRLIPELHRQFGDRVIASSPVNLRAILAGDYTSTTAVFSLHCDPAVHLQLQTPFCTVAQPKDTPVNLDGSLTIEPGDAGSFQVNNANLIIGDALLQSRGKYSWSDDPAKLPALECTLAAPNPVPAQTVAAILNTPSLSNVNGTVTGELSISGPLNKLTSCGFLSFDKVGLPQYNIAALTGRIETPGWSFDRSEAAIISSAGSKTNLHLDSIKIGALEAQSVDAQVVLESPDSRQQTPRLVLQEGKAQLAGGTLNLTGWADLSEHRFHLDAGLNKVQTSMIASQLLGHPGEISGWADAHVTLESKGTEYREIMGNLDGQAKVTVESGKVARFGPLQEKLTQANLLQSGILGFNLNNLLQSVMPVRTGEFKKLEASLAVANGVMNIAHLKFNGDDMRLRAAGTINPVLNTVALEVAGNVPRVSSSLLSSAVGEVSRDISIQKLMSLLTMHKLENLPALPLLGDIADDRPRSFVFHVVAPMDDSHLLVQSIQKTFHWIPNHLNASAHPVPGLSWR